MKIVLITISLLALRSILFVLKYSLTLLLSVAEKSLRVFAKFRVLCCCAMKILSGVYALLLRAYRLLLLLLLLKPVFRAGENLLRLAGSDGLLTEAETLDT